MCVSGRLSVTPLHSVVDVRDTPENINFFRRQAVASDGPEVYSLRTLKV